MSIFVQSLLGGLVIDVERNQDSEGALTDADTMKLKGLTVPPTPAQLADAANQLWDFVDGPFPNSFFIQSAMNDVDGKPLVLDIKGGKPVIGAEVQVFRKKDTLNAQQNEGAKNQLWQWKAPPPPPPNSLAPAGQFIESLLGSDLVIDIKGGKNTPGAALQVNQAKTITQADFQVDFTAAANQLWIQAETFVEPPK